MNLCHDCPVVILGPSVAVGVLERSLRALMTHEYTRAYGADWFTKVTTDKQREAVARAQGQEVPRRKGVADVPPLGLQYLDLLALIEIAREHWDPLREALGKRDSTLSLLWRFYDLRNPSQHSRDLVPFEHELMSGIAGQIQNQVTLHMSSQDTDGAYYPRITAASDSLGHEVRIEAVVGEIAGSYGSYPAETILQPGDVLTFTVLGDDPQGRALKWTLHAGKTQRQVAEMVEPSGGPVQLQWIVNETDVGESSHAIVYMTADGAKYHRANGFDHRVNFHYRVRPLDHP